MPIKFDSLEYSSIQEFKKYGGSKRKFKIWCHIGELEDPQFYKDNGKLKIASSVTFVDDRKNRLDSIPVSKSRYNSLEKRIEIGMPVEVIGKPVRQTKTSSKGKKVVYNLIEVLRTREGNTPLRVLNASRREIKLVEKFLDKAKKKIKAGNKWYLLNTLKNAIISELNLFGLDDNKRLSDTIETMILQAISCGEVQNSNGKIHVCIIGPSASGKKLCFKTGELMNVVCKEAQPASVSPVGLTGACVKNGKWKVTKGALALAHKGLFGIQDFDKSSKIKELLEVMAPVMEDAKCIVQKAGNVEHLAETGIYIDLNRESDLELDEALKENIIKDTKLRTHILSRFDFICEFNKNIENQFKAVIDSVKEKNGKETERDDYLHRFCKKNNIDIKRFFSLISAYLMENYNDIKTNKIGNQIEAHLKGMRKVNKDNLDKIKDLHQFLFRYRNSCYKFINSLSRIQLIKTAQDEAAEKAFKLLRWKLKFLGNLMPLKRPSMKVTKEHDFHVWLKKSYSKTKFNIDKAYKSWKKDGFPGGKVEERQFRNRVTKYAVQDKHGLWKLQ